MRPFAGEPLPEATRKRIEATYNCKMFDHIGSTETCGCRHVRGSGGLHIVEPFFSYRATGQRYFVKRSVEGELGVIVITPLGRRSFPVIRFNTNDVAIRPSTACGRTSIKLMEIVGRVDDISKIRGILSLRRPSDSLSGPNSLR